MDLNIFKYVIRIFRIRLDEVRFGLGWIRYRSIRWIDGYVDTPHVKPQ